MKVSVKLFAGLRERAGWSARELELPDGAKVKDVWAELDLGEQPRGIHYALNKGYADKSAVLADGDEVALIPPVSGGDFRLSEEPLSLDAVVAEVAGERAGAIATFTGTTRIESRGRMVRWLDYEAYAEMAESEMLRIGNELYDRGGISSITIVCLRSA